MIKRLVVFSFFVAIFVVSSSVGFAKTRKGVEKYESIFNQGIVQDDSVSLIIEGSLKEVKARVLDTCSAVGYPGHSFSSSEYGFIALAKDESLANFFLIGDRSQEKILIRFRILDENKIRVDLLPGTKELGSLEEIKYDIKVITAFLRNRWNK